MNRLLIAGVCLASLCVASGVQAQGTYDAKWIAANTLNPAAATKVWFRTEVRSKQPSTGLARVVADGDFTLWVNGQRIGQGSGQKIHRFNLNGIVGRGLNVVAVEFTNTTGQGGLYIDGEIRGQGGTHYPFDSGELWKATLSAPKGDGWKQVGFDDSEWKSLKVVGPHEESPWKSFALEDSYLDRYIVAPGLELERIAEPKLVGTIIAMTWGNRGRLIAARERGPIVSVIDEDNDGTYEKVVELTNVVHNCQGLCMVFDELYAAGEGPQGTGIYRIIDRNKDDIADRIEQVFAYKGRIVDHGPHAIVYGPDGWLYNNMGNHAFVTATPEATTPVRDFYEGHLLQPKFEDANGHASGLKAPAGTIWRFTPDGKKFWCETSGFRNEYDIAFNTNGDLFSFDSDMEWDVGMPWYRPVRVNHCIPGAEFGWRSGCAKWPVSHFDSLPGTVDIGRGSPTGVMFYEHNHLPEQYQGAFLICDWSVGRILSVRLSEDGATFKGESENFVTGNPLNVTDIDVDRDGSVVFSVGGRGTEGGIYRVSNPAAEKKTAEAESISDVLDLPQLQSAWARELVVAVKKNHADAWEPQLVEIAQSGSSAHQIRALTLLSQYGPKPSADLLAKLAGGDDAQVRAFATWLLGSHPSESLRTLLTGLLSDESPVVRRRACEAFVRAGIEPPVEPLLALLADEDRWLRFAARVALERIPVAKWRVQVLSVRNPHVVTHGLLALYRRGEIAGVDDAFHADEALKLEANLLTGKHGPLTTVQKREVLRTIELTLLAGGGGPVVGTIAQTLLKEFPSGDAAVDSDSARILAALQVPDAVAKVMDELETVESQSRQIDYALTLRYFDVGWNIELKRRMLDWYESTHSWEGGHSFTPYLANIVGAGLKRFQPEERTKFMLDWKARPYAAGLLIEKSSVDEVPDFEKIVTSILNDASQSAGDAQWERLVSSAIDALGRSGSEDSLKLLRDMFDQFPDRREQLARALAKHPTEVNWTYLVGALSFGDTTTLQLCLRGLREAKSKNQTPQDIRAIILAGLRLGSRRGFVAVNLLKDLSGEKHGAGKDFDAAIAYYQNWYQQEYPDAPAAELPKEDQQNSKYAFKELVRFLAENPKGKEGDAQRGQKIFAKAKCIKCHRFLNEGESVGPDLTSIRRRFQRKEIIESLVYPSQVISDQYRMVTVVTVDGLVHNGMPVPGNVGDDSLVLLLSDATKLTIPKEDIDEQVRSKVSVMPVGTLKELSLDEIADLFAFLETSKFNKVTARSASAQSNRSAQSSGN